MYGMYGMYVMAMYGLHLKRGGIYEQLWCRSWLPDAARRYTHKGQDGSQWH